MWVLVPSFRRVLAEDTDLRADLSTELYGWPEALATLEGIVDEVKLEAGGEDPVVVGPHWVVCAQVEAGARHLRVGCATPNRDDFDDWMPREQWRQASTLVVVRDGRFEDDIGVWAPGHVAVRDVWLEVRRAGRLLRRFRYTVLHRAV
jgi:hypothetical protein